MDTLFLALRVVVSLSAVLGVIWFAQRRLTKGKLLQKVVREIRVVGRQSLGSKASVVLIEADGKRMMLGVTDHSITLLDSSPAKADHNAAAPPKTVSPSQPQPSLQPQPSAEASAQSSSPSEAADFASLLATAETAQWSDAGPTPWKRPRATLRRGSHR